MSTEAAPAIIVFDGVCHLCSGWVQFLLRRDRRGRYRFASMQSDSGRALLRTHGLDPDTPVSMLLLEGERARTDSDAILAVVEGLGGAWRAVRVFRLLPGVLRDPLYRWIARHRYRLFGRRSQCWLPDPAHAALFLD
jgi:predicted DCC family thiol-disulfide oxidoreductase YuxK